MTFWKCCWSRLLFWYIPVNPIFTITTILVNYFSIVLLLPSNKYLLKFCHFPCVFIFSVNCTSCIIRNIDFLAEIKYLIHRWNFQFWHKIMIDALKEYFWLICEIKLINEYKNKRKNIYASLQKKRMAGTYFLSSKTMERNQKSDLTSFFFFLKSSNWSRMKGTLEPKT